MFYQQNEAVSTFSSFDKLAVRVYGVSASFHEFGYDEMSTELAT